MKKMKMTRRLLSLVLCLCMVLTMLPVISPVMVNAAGTEGMITIELTDSFGDGWNGNAIEIYAGDALLDTATLVSGSNGTWSIAWDTHLTYTFQWVRGNYTDETSFVIYLGTEEKVNSSGDVYGTGDTLLTLESLCSEPEFENSICLHCGKSCVHRFADSVCTLCGFVCGTDKVHGWDKGICSVCGMECEHDNWTDCICGICGFACGSDRLHSFDDCVCTVCGFACGTHKPHNWQSGVCTVCHLNCNHESVTEGVCATCSGTCGVSFAHSFNTDDQCTICGFVCFHTWESGKCTACGRNCAHETYENGFCTRCDDCQSAVDADGDGYYDIANAGNLYWLAGKVNGGDDSINAELTADIVVNENVLNADGTLRDNSNDFRSWTAIGFSRAKSYSGKFNGNEYTISGLYCAKDDEYAGLFGCVDGGSVEWVGVVDSYFYTNYTASSAGGVAASLENNKDGKVLHCFNSGTVRGRSSSGGVVGEVQSGTVKDCYNTGLVKGVNDAGGVIGYTYNATIANCYNSGSVEGSYAYVGGVIGHYTSSTTAAAPLTHCYNTGDVVNTGYMGKAGGVVGSISVNMSDCYSTGSVSGEYAGGIVGILNANGIILSNSYYNSDVFTGSASGDANDTIVNCVGLPMEQFCSGEVCWLMNGSSSEGLWKQTLGTDSTPVFVGETVYQVSGTYCTGDATTVYSNTDASVDAVHKDETKDHICDGCGETANECRDFNRDHLCDVCSGVLSEHAGGTATCNAKAMCTLCGQEYGEKDPSTHDSEIAFDGNGFCVNGCFEPAADTDSDGYYEIGNAGQLYWFAQLVNLKGQVTAKAILTADIDLGNRIWYPIGLYGDPAVPDGEALVVQYNGVIDGKGHTVSNFKAIGYGSQGLVGYSASNAIVRNLGVINAEVSGWNAGAVMAYMGTVENCYAMDCSITGSTTGSATVYVGAVSGTQQSLVRNCFAYNCVLSEAEGVSANMGAVGGATAVNTYFGKLTVTSGNLRFTEEEFKVYDEQFVSGELAYLLGEGWGQTIGEQSHPVPGGEKVYYSYLSCDETVMDMGYSNLASRPDHNPEEDDGDCTTAVNCAACGNVLVEAEDTHTPDEYKDNENDTHSYTCTLCGKYVTEGHSFGEDKLCTGCGAINCAHDGYPNGICRLCGKYDKPTCNADGYYEINNAGKLFWFAEEVNKGNFDFNAVLTKDVDLENLPWTPIGRVDPFKGIFDGDGHSIVGLNLNGSEPYNAFIGNLAEGGVKNLSLTGTLTGTVENPSENISYGLLVGTMLNSAIYNCTTSGTISVSTDNSESYNAYVGGMAGRGEHCVMINCGTDVEISYPSSAVSENINVYVGGVVGYLSVGYEEPQCILNSYAWGDITIGTANLAIESHAVVGGIVGYLRDDAVNNHYAGTITANVGEGAEVGYAFGHVQGYTYPAQSETPTSLIISHNYYPQGQTSVGIGVDAIDDTWTVAVSQEDWQTSSGDTALCSILNANRVYIKEIITQHLGFLEESQWQQIVANVGGEDFIPLHWKVSEGSPVLCFDQITECSCESCGEIHESNDDASCTEDEICLLCGEILKEAGHTEEIIPGKTPTCTDTGLTEGVKCTICGEILTNQEELPASGEHVFENGTCIYGCGTTQSFTVSFAGDGTRHLQSLTVAPGTVITLPCRWYDLGSSDGRVFAGFNTEEDGSGETYMDCTSYAVTENVTLYAQWADIAIGDALLNSGEYVDTEGNITTTRPEGGYAYFDKGNLTLHDFVYEGEGYIFAHHPDSGRIYTSAIHYEMGDLNVVVEGENSLSNTIGESYGLRSHGNMTVSGNGSLNLNAEGIPLFSGMNLTLEGDALELTATTIGDDAIYAVGSITMNSGTVCLESGNFAMNAEGSTSVGNITINGGILNMDSQRNGLMCLGAFIVTDGTVTISAGEGFDAVIAYDGITIENVKLLSPENGKVMQVGSYFTIVDSSDNTATGVVIGKEHAHTEEIIPGKAPTCGETGLTEGVKCSVCGEILDEQEEIPATGEHIDADKDNRCDTCGCLMTLPSLSMKSISLEGNIAINYYMLLPEAVVADENAYMQFTMVDGEIMKVPVSEATKKQVLGQVYYVFTCAMDAAEMSDDVVCSFFYEGGSTEAFTYSVQTYAKNVLGKNPNERLETLLKSMLNYGAASQLYFKHRTDDLANAGFEAPDYSDVTITGFDKTADQGTQLAVFSYASLILESETTLRFFFRVDSTVENFKVKHKGQNLEVNQRDDLYYVDVVGILAKDLDETVTITIDDGNQTAEVSYNPMAYCQSVLNNNTGIYDQSIKELVVALYLYNQAANNYFA